MAHSPEELIRTLEAARASARRGNRWREISDETLEAAIRLLADNVRVAGERDEAVSEYLRRHNDAVDHLEARIAAETRARHMVGVLRETRRLVGKCAEEGFTNDADVMALFVNQGKISAALSTLPQDVGEGSPALAESAASVASDLTAGDAQRKSEGWKAVDQAIDGHKYLVWRPADPHPRSVYGFHAIALFDEGVWTLDETEEEIDPPSHIAELLSNPFGKHLPPNTLFGLQVAHPLTDHAAGAAGNDGVCEVDFGEVASAAFLKVTGVSLDGMEAGSQQFYISFAVELAAHLSPTPPAPSDRVTGEDGKGSACTDLLGAGPSGPAASDRSRKSELVARHTHDGSGEDPDTCARCGEDFRSEIHLRAHEAR